MGMALQSLLFVAVGAAAAAAAATAAAVAGLQCSV
jgi:hypothetical protein